MARIAILTHRTDAFEQIPYFLREIGKVWLEMGIEVLVPKAPCTPIAADLAILHVDRTVVPSEYLAWGRQFPRCLNLYTADISKRVISRHLVSRTGSYKGPVIVKSNLNCGGLKEHEERALRAKTAVPPNGQYMIYPSVSEVPAIGWTSPDWVVEEFLPEMSDGQYCLRTWVFLGDGETNSLSFAVEPIIKSANVLRRVPIDNEIPEELRAKREELGFDFGKFDYVLHNGEVVLFDVNRTPSVGAFTPEQFLPRVRKYAEGIWSFLPKGRG
ncbi:MAG: hypothetical protein HZC36_12665 [Armatimonadetes bacterium]|nr:hypothetical protein [Armatimonadota bacterium]